MTQDVSANAAPYTVEFITTTRDDLVDLSRLLARALDPDLLKVEGQPIVFTVNGSHSSGKKIVSDVIFEEISHEHDMVFSGRKGYDEFYLDPSDEGLQLSYIDLAYGYGYETESLREPGKTSSALLMESFMKVCQRQPGVAVLQNNKVDVDGIHVWIEDGMRAPTHNPRGVEELGKPGAQDAAAQFCAAREKLNHRGWVRRVRLDITDTRLLQTPMMQYAVEVLSAEAANVKALLSDKSAPAEALLARPYGRPFQPKT